MTLHYKYFRKDVFDAHQSEFLRITRNHPDVLKNLFSSAKVTQTQQKAWYEHYSDNIEHSIFIVYHKSDMLGYFQTHYKGEGVCEAGYVVHPRHQGQGVGRKVIDWSLSYLFENEIRRVELEVFPENEAAIELYQTCGFKPEATMRDYAFKDGRFRDVILMSIIAI